MYHQDLYNTAIEAIRNGDLAFRLPEDKAVFPGEKAAIATINSMLEIMQEQRQNIEMASWEKLTRILTHEIMNSLAPIVSLSDTFMENESVLHSDMYEGIKTIHDTSEGLISFVDSYRKYSSLQKPKPETIDMASWLNVVTGIITSNHDVSVETRINPETLQISFDPNLLRQVLINIMKNAIEAQATQIQINAYQYADSPARIRISNNGSTISDDERQEIFVPFFTTKKSGNGIGLSLCRQIMTISGDSIELLPSNTNGWSTSFQLEFASSRIATL